MASGICGFMGDPHQRSLCFGLLLSGWYLRGFLQVVIRGHKKVWESRQMVRLLRLG
jgi:hypothetical protein